MAVAARCTTTKKIWNITQKNIKHHKTSQNIKKILVFFLHTWTTCGFFWGALFFPTFQLPVGCIQPARPQGSRATPWPSNTGVRISCSVWRRRCSSTTCRGGWDKGRGWGWGWGWRVGIDGRWWICYMSIWMYIFTHTYMHACICTYVHTYIHTYIPTYLPTYLPTYVRTYVRTYIHTYIHTYVYICMYIYIWIFPEICTKIWEVDDIWRFTKPGRPPSSKSWRSMIESMEITIETTWNHD